MPIDARDSASRSLASLPEVRRPIPRRLRYFIACVDDDGTAPKLHYEVGMVREFTVQ